MFTVVYTERTHAGEMPDIVTFPEFIQLLDDDIVSLTALTLLVDPQCRDADDSRYVVVSLSQMTLSLYLMTQCQVKLRHSMMSLAQTLDYIKVAHRRHGVLRTLDHLILKMIARKALTYVTTVTRALSTLHGVNHLTRPD